jgi:hypothetical protein
VTSFPPCFSFKNSCLRKILFYLLKDKLLTQHQINFCCKLFTRSFIWLLSRRYKLTRMIKWSAKDNIVMWKFGGAGTWNLTEVKLGGYVSCRCINRSWETCWWHHGILVKKKSFFYINIQKLWYNILLPFKIHKYNVSSQSENRNGPS